MIGNICTELKELNRNPYTDSLYGISFPSKSE